MAKNIFLPLSFIILIYGFYTSENFKEISAGVAIFLFGMLSLEEGFKSFTGGLLNKILKHSTDKLYKSILFGAITTSIMQSSSLVSVITISFLSAGLIGLSQGVGIIFGANLGTTTGAWLVAGFGLKVSIASYAMPMLVFGIIFIFQKSKSLKGLGYILAGLGFLFLGIHYMKEGFESFKDTIDLSLYSVDGIKGLLIFAAIGVFATVVMQSSHATLVLIITALSVGQISYENALALAIGSNVGTTITAILGSMSSNIDGKRLAGAHLIFNFVTALIAIVFIHEIIYLVDITAKFLTIDKDDYTLKLAIFHTIFNLIGITVMIPFIDILVKFLEKQLKSPKEDEEIGYDTSKYLTDLVLEFPETSIEAILKETRHLYENSFEVIAHGLNLKRSNIISNINLDEIIKEKYSKRYIDIEDFYHHKIKNIYGDILDFSTKAQSNMNASDIENLYRLKLATRDMIEAVKDTKHLQKNLVKYAAHPNKYIKEQYSSIKKSIASLLRSINFIATSDAQDEVILMLSRVKLDARKHDVISNGVLDNLIRNKLITNEMATSLMNDSTYAFNISKNLANMAEILFIENGLTISDNDIENILDKKEIV